MFKLSPKLAIIFALIINIWTSSNMHFGGENWRSIISSDACGYYAYLPAIFIYKDLHFSHYDKVEMSPQYYSEYLTQEYRNKVEGGIVDKYYVGCAVLWAPFFGAAHLLAESMGYPADGYSKPYHLALCWASILYLASGMYCLSLLLTKLCFSDFSIFWALLVTEFASNLFYYASPLPSFSHVYSFSMVCIFLYFGHKALTVQKWQHWLISACLLGIITLIRPVNILIVAFLPLLYANWKDFWLRIKSGNLPQWTVAIAGFTLIVFIQLIIYKIQTGHFLVMSYSGESFDFLHPQLWGYLFSFRKGFFIYTPVFLPVFLFALYILWKTKPYKMWALLLPMYAVWHVAASWWCWWYGYGYSQRPMVDFMFVLTFAVCLFLDYFHEYRNRLAGVLFIFILFTQFQTYQARYGLILPDLMTKELYFKEFLNVQGVIDKTR